MNRREILKSFIALPFIGKILTNTTIPKVLPSTLPPTGAADAITFSLQFDKDLLISYATIVCGMCKNTHEIDLIYEPVDNEPGLYTAKIPDDDMRCSCTKQ